LKGNIRMAAARATYPSLELTQRNLCHSVIRKGDH
jgi:hypothetical protein